jgi:folate-binding protein YgfZ
MTSVTTTSAPIASAPAATAPLPLGAAEILVIEGADAIAFAQAQFTSGVAELAQGAWQWSAWLDAQGRARHFFALLRIDATRLLAWQPLGDAAGMRAALARFVFRSKVALDAPSGWALHALRSLDLPASANAREFSVHRDGYALAMPGTTDRIAWLAPSGAAAVAADALAEWRVQDIAARLPLLASASSGEFVPQALELERHDAIRFDKGCYPGQEVAARLHFRGGNKRRLLRLSIAGAPPAPAAQIIADGSHVAGQVLYAAPVSTQTSEALAVVADTYAEAANLTTSSGGSSVAVSKIDV